METTTLIERLRDGVAEREAATEARVDELASLSAHLSAATARWLELVWEMREEGDSNGHLTPFGGHRVL